MTTYVALLRGINLGGRRKVPMTALRELITDLGYEDVRTLLQSGNVVFTGGEQPPALLARELEQALQARFGFEIGCVVLTSAELRAVVARNPFPVASFDPSKFVVTFLAAPLDPAHLARIDPEAYLPDEFRPGERELFLHCPNGLGRSKLSAALGATDFGTVATTRNWNTVTKLLAMADV
ncbi:DUF1697 domain-containing protein [Streptomyces pathocidini]|uniref:DUF1697 domain-containing protein n=1 Tax=Streptomyces pathocidini TaxID=1650571 RepID=UPI0033E26F84